MNCAVCGKEFGIWARLSGDADDQVCKSCEEEGPQRLDRVLGQLGPRADLGARAREFEELAKKFRVPAELLSGRQAQLVERAAVAISEKELLGAADVDFLNGLLRQFGMASTPAGSELGAACTRIDLRQGIGSWERGKIPEVDCKGLLLEAGEVCHMEIAARLLEQRSRREYVGTSQGFSVRLARGVSYRVGAFRGHPIDTAYLADCGGGWLHITSKRIAFTGGESAVAIGFKKIISVSGYEDGFAIFRTGAKKPTVFQVAHPELTLQLLGLATPAKND